jgi:AcrR family transcriptional regulator
MTLGRLDAMARWEPHVQERLEQAALDLYATKGYDSTTVGDIAARAGVTSRTYFRYFPDKREVLFGGAAELHDRIARTLHDAPADLPPLEATLHAMSACEDLYDAREREQLRRRDAVIRGSGELQEREARKLAAIAGAVAGELGERGASPDSAQLVADLALAVFTQAARLWMDDPRTPYATQLHRAADQARDIVSNSRTTAPP